MALLQSRFASQHESITMSGSSKLPANDSGATACSETSGLGIRLLCSSPQSFKFEVFTPPSAPVYGLKVRVPRGAKDLPLCKSMSWAQLALLGALNAEIADCSCSCSDDLCESKYYCDASMEVVSEFSCCQIVGDLRQETVHWEISGIRSEWQLHSGTRSFRRETMCDC